MQFHFILGENASTSVTLFDDPLLTEFRGNKFINLALSSVHLSQEHTFMLFYIFLAFQHKSLTNQEEIKTELGEVKKLLIKFLATQSSNNPAATTTTGITDIPVLPLKSVQDWNELNTWLMSDGNYKFLVSLF